MTSKKYHKEVQVHQESADASSIFCRQVRSKEGLRDQKIRKKQEIVLKGAQGVQGLQ